MTPTLRPLAFVTLCAALMTAALHALATDSPEPTSSAAYTEALEVFNRRILPIMRSSDASSCAECHLSGVDLRDYILDTPERTFIALRDRDLVDLEHPMKSRILEFIRMSKPETERLTADTRSMELEAFEAWITACVASKELRDAPPIEDGARVGPAADLEVLRHVRTDRLYQSFLTNVWAQIERCGGCHSPSSQDFAERLEENGERVGWVSDTPEATLDYIIERGLVNPVKPASSLMLLKATNQVEHGGGKKMETGDRGYKQFRAFIDDYAASTMGRYRNPAQLPEASDVTYIHSPIWMRVEPTRAEWGDKLLGVTIHAYDEAAGEFSNAPIASSDRGVWGDGELWQHNLILEAPKGSDLAARLDETRVLPTGRYLIRLYCDIEGRLKEDWKLDLFSEQFYVGQLDVESEWPAGYGDMEVFAPPTSDGRVSR